jgi:hypothetical protein
MLLIQIKGRKAHCREIETIIINIAQIIAIDPYTPDEFRVILRDNLYYYVEERYKNVIMRKVNALY